MVTSASLLLSACLGAAVLATSPLPAAPNFGGISGLDHRDDGTFFALSDDPSSRAPARFYQVALPPAEPARVLSTTTLTDPSGAPYAPGTVDPESLRVLDPTTVAWTTETTGQIVVSTVTGRELRRITPPAYHHPDAAGTTGFRPNASLEGLAFVPQLGQLVTVTEASLIQDGPRNTPTAGMRVRITRFDLATGTPLAEYALHVDPLYPGAADRGVSEIIADPAHPGTGFYILERGYLPGHGNRAEIYRIDTSAATDVLGRPRLDGTETPVTKQLVADLAADGANPDNVEALSWDPDEPGVLLVASDDNFNPVQKGLVHRVRTCQ